ncbi:protein FANTASTIC FOUR 3-like [Rutidosis leptorrhynchoides]|uniref:protein FANTASTIC FOUR 3-like n=1 Tax=Rutidosis leptorrhynchoides TaxID=125765 RepID=UPI003A9A50CE
MSKITFQQQPSMDSSHIVETTTMRLKLVSSPKSYNKKTIFEDYFNNSETNSYVHNKKSLILSQKSLELCTESLGSETGSDTSEDDIIFVVPKSVKRCRRDQMESKKVMTRNFPPPLTTISGSKPFQVRPHREGGRLIIEASETNLGNNCLRAERSDGRLRLTCWKTDFDNENNENERNDLEKGEDEIERNVVVEKLQRVRRCIENGHGDKGIITCCNWVATS